MNNPYLVADAHHPHNIWLQHKNSSRLLSWTIAATVLFAFLAASAILFSLPQNLGIYIPATSITADYLFAVILSIGILGSLIWLPVSREDRYALAILWAIKSIVSLFAMLWYEAYYNFLDSYSYFFLGQNYLSTVGTLAFGEGTNLITYLCGLLLSILPGEYHTLKQIFSLIGLAGIYCFYRAITTFTGRTNIAWLLGLGLFPSIVFWTSIIGKDPIVLFGLGLFFLGAAQMFRKADPFAFLLMFAGVLLSSAIRPWLGMILSPAIIFLATQSARTLLARLLIIGIALAIAIVGITLAADRLQFSSQQEALEQLDNSARGWSEHGDSGQRIEANLSNPVELIAFLPYGIFTTLYRPLPGEIPNAFGILASLENTFLLVLTLRALFRLTRANLKQKVVIFSLLFLMGWLTLYAPVSFQNLGTAARFKVQILPVMLALLIYLGRKPSNLPAIR